MKVSTLPLANITVAKDRQRSELGDIKSLAASILQAGLIQPIVVHREGEQFHLVAGERRLRAHQHIGWNTIEAVELEDLSSSERALLELEENLKRKNLTWIEEVKATAAYAALRDGESDSDIATSLGLNIDIFRRKIIVAEELSKNPYLSEAKTWSNAYEIVNNTRKRQLESIMENIHHDPAGLPPLPLPFLALKPLSAKEEHDKIVADASRPAAKIVPPPSAAPFRAELEDFSIWSKSYAGPRFNLLHCDFPYGLDMNSANLQNSSARWGAEDKLYEDSPELFDRLLRSFFDYQDGFVAESAHCIFWVAHKNYGRVAGRFRHYGWEVADTALIWHKSDSKGIAPKPYFEPRRTYEMAVFAYRGGRKLVQLKNASFSNPTAGADKVHLSEKPLAVVEYFLEMICDKFSEVLDPTCGSGTSLEIAQKLGAKRAFGLDVEEKWVEHTNGRLKK